MPQPTAAPLALLLDVDPVRLVVNRRGLSGEGGMLDRYVNDRRYVTSPFMRVAIAGFSILLWRETAKTLRNS
jgi:hypothetical protein